MELQDEDRLLCEFDGLYQSNQRRHAHVFHRGSRRANKSHHHRSDERGDYRVRRAETKVEFPIEQGNHQDWRSRALSFADVAREGCADYLLALRVDVFEASGSSFGFTDTDVQRFRSERISFFRGVLSDARSFG